MPALRPIDRWRFGPLPGLIAFALVVTAGCRHAQNSPAKEDVWTPPPGVFRDVAREAGIEFHWGHSGKSPLNLIESIGHGCAFLDYDQDGLLDILLVGNHRCALYRNMGSGRFKNVTKKSGLTAEGDFFGVAVGDYDNDGYPDLYITGYGKCVLYHNEPAPRTTDDGRRTTDQNPKSKIQNRKFVDVTAGSGVEARGPYDVVTAAAFVDFDGDGKLDLFAGRYVVFNPNTIQLCDYHGIKGGCGVKDYAPDFPRVYRNLGRGHFEDVTAKWGFGALHGKCLGVAVSAADSGLGVTLYAANDERPGDLMVFDGHGYKNDGATSGTAFNHEGGNQGGMGVDWGDFNNDGKPDLVVATFQNEPKSLYRNDGRGLFSEVGIPMGIASDTSPYVGWTTKFFDYDNDGRLDLFFTNGHTQDNADKIEAGRTYRQPMQLFHNDGAEGFSWIRAASEPALGLAIVGRGAAFGDFDNDGRIDVLVVNEEGTALLLHNESTNANHWLGVRLVGTRCNRDAVGARVSVTANGKTYVRDQQICGGYLSCHDPRLHFGLADARKVEQIIVRWPDGKTDTVKDVPADRYIEIAEGKGRRE